MFTIWLDTREWMRTTRLESSPVLLQHYLIDFLYCKVICARGTSGEGESPGLEFPQNMVLMTHHLALCLRMAIGNPPQALSTIYYSPPQCLWDLGSRPVFS